MPGIDTGKCRVAWYQIINHALRRITKIGSHILKNIGVFLILYYVNLDCFLLDSFVLLKYLDL